MMTQMQTFDPVRVVPFCFQLPNGFGEIAKIRPLFSYT